MTNKELELLEQISAELNEPALPASFFRVINAETGKIKMRLAVYHSCDDIKVIRQGSIDRSTNIDELRKLRRLEKNGKVVIRQWHLHVTDMYLEYDYYNNRYIYGG